MIFETIEFTENFNGNLYHIFSPLSKMCNHNFVNSRLFSAWRPTLKLRMEIYFSTIISNYHCMTVLFLGLFQLCYPFSRLERSNLKTCFYDSCSGLKLMWAVKVMC